MSSLGKGLESLIPPNHGKPGSGQASAGGKKPNDDGGQVIDPPRVLVPEEELPAASAVELPAANSVELPPGLELDPASELEAAPELPELPAAQPLRSAVAAPILRETDSPKAKKQKENEAIYYVELSKIVPNKNQPRRYFDEDALKDLASSIREFGVLQPIVVTKHDIEVPGGTEVEYELIAGERRLMASKLLGLERIPAIIRHVDLERERLELAIIENLQREDLNPMEMARAFSRLQDEFRLTQREIAARLGKSRETVANTMRLLDLPTYIQEAIEKGQVSESHGRLLLGIEDPAAQQTLFQQLLTQKFTTRELRDRARHAAKTAKTMEPAVEVLPEAKMFEQQLASELGAPVTIQGKSSGGKITINFYSEEELRSIISRIVKEGE